MSLLPAEHLLKLKNIYIVHSDMGIKLAQMFSFGEINSFLRKKTVHNQKYPYFDSVWPKFNNQIS